MTSIAIAICSLSVLIFAHNMHSDLHITRSKQHIQALANNLAADISEAMISSERAKSLPIILQTVQVYKDIKLARVLDLNRRPIASVYGLDYLPNLSKKDDFDGTELSEMAIGTSYNEQQISLFTTIGDASRPTGYLLLIKDTSQFATASQSQLLKTALPLTLLIILCTLLVSLWVNQRLLSPFSYLARIAQTIKETNDYSIRLSVRGKQEVKELSAEFASMMHTIHVEELKNRSFMQQLLRQRKDMERLANFDALTGLPNRQHIMTLLRTALADAHEDDSNIILMYLDLDGFKGVNDTHGHEAGDDLLIEVSNRIKTCIRQGDVVARLGGDEFLIMLHKEPEQLRLNQLCERIIRQLAKPFDIDNWEVNISASVGIAHARDANYHLSEFVSNADVAMYRSKIRGKNTYTIFATDMMEDNKRRVQIANDIPSALKEDEFDIYYQPKVNIEERIIGFEALIRWQSASLGWVSPSEFIPIAEKSGRVSDITLWVMARLAEDMSSILRHFGEHMTVAVNLSSIDLRNEDFTQKLTELFRSDDLSPSNIELEITESAYLENVELANQWFDDMRQLGVKIALDDFGTGYSSLSYLTQISLDTLKIDKQFVDQLGLSERSTLVTKTIIEMAKQLKLTICAEGVETRSQVQFLAQQGCHQLQGYLFGKPMPISELLNMADSMPDPLKLVV